MLCFVGCILPHIRGCPALHQLHPQHDPAEYRIASPIGRSTRHRTSFRGRTHFQNSAAPISIRTQRTPSTLYPWPEFSAHEPRPHPMFYRLPLNGAITLGAALYREGRYRPASGRSFVTGLHGGERLLRSYSFQRQIYSAGIFHGRGLGAARTGTRATDARVQICARHSLDLQPGHRVSHSTPRPKTINPACIAGPRSSEMAASAPMV